MQKSLVDKLVEEWTENIDEAKIAETTLFDRGNKCVCSYTVCVALVVIALTASIGISAHFSCKYMNCNKKMFVNTTTSIKQQRTNINGKYQRN